MNDKLKQIAIFGAGGFGLEVAMLIEQINEVQAEWEIIGFFDDGVDEGKIVNGYPVLGGIDRLNNWESELSLSLALGIPNTKKTVFGKIQNDMLSDIYVGGDDCACTDDASFTDRHVFLTSHNDGGVD